MRPRSSPPALARPSGPSRRSVSVSRRAARSDARCSLVRPSKRRLNTKASARVPTRDSADGAAPALAGWVVEFGMGSVDGVYGWPKLNDVPRALFRPHSRPARRCGRRRYATSGASGAGATDDPSSDGASGGGASKADANNDAASGAGDASTAGRNRRADNTPDDNRRGDGNTLVANTAGSGSVCSTSGPSGPSGPMPLQAPRRLPWLLAPPSPAPQRMARRMMQRRP